MESAAWLEKSRLFADMLLPEMRGRWRTIDQIGLPQPYAKTHKFEGEFINDNHRRIGTAPLGHMGIPICIDLGIDGYLQREEALKLYELAYFNKGDARSNWERIRACLPPLSPMACGMGRADVSKPSMSMLKPTNWREKTSPIDPAVARSHLH
jgi:hypothetical protein